MTTMHSTRMKTAARRRHGSRNWVAALAALWTATTATTALAGPLDPAQLPADTKWVVHFDVQSFLRSQMGRTLAKEVLDPRLTEGARQLKARLGVDYDWHDLHGLTFYGRNYDSPRRVQGTLLIDGRLDLKAGLEAVMERQEGAAKDGPVSRLADGQRALYSLEDRAFVGLNGRKPAILGRSQEQIEAARQVLLGEAPSLARQPKGALELPRKNRSFILVAAAKGFADQTPLPPQARVLKMADGLQATLRESGADLVLDVVLLTKDDQVTQQIVNVVQGLKALASLSQPDNQDLQDLAQGLSVRSSNKRVSVTLRMRSKTVTDRIVEKVRKNER